ncbi:hypothetical protein Nepgr_011789 [Nepenthes gracilis]|uniref:Uncharacterized protein n=1 Tax=Nepenthes gracilis TaxID=150966 RepID=A0AAD3SEQ3_NEPGR|nr:hypothetical protein Nepgr_011789 [Nepenthes gracilis]
MEEQTQKMLLVVDFGKADEEVEGEVLAFWEEQRVVPLTHPGDLSIASYGSVAQRQSKTTKNTDEGQFGLGFGEGCPLVDKTIVVEGGIEAEKVALELASNQLLCFGNGNNGGSTKRGDMLC